MAHKTSGLYSMFALANCECTCVKGLEANISKKNPSINRLDPHTLLHSCELKFK